MNPDGSDHKVIVTDCQFLDDGIAVDVRAGVHVAAAPAGGRGTQCNLAKRRVESLKVLAEERPGNLRRGIQKGPRRITRRPLLARRRI